jgi:DNA-binding CsgD family transcriptional regulator
MGWLALDEIDYGIVVLDREGEVLHANRRARAEFEAGGHPLVLTGGRLKARSHKDGLRLAEALDAVRRGLRRLLEMDHGSERISFALVPLPASLDERPSATLLLTGRRRICENLSVQSFARANGLTLAETRVLESLCAGETAGTVARCQGVALSTVRSHIVSIRMKTGTRCLQELTRRVAALPPLVSALHMAS